MSDGLVTLMKKNMNRNTAIGIVVGLAAILTGCKTSTPDSESGPDKTVAYYVKVESSEPGVTVETNSVSAGKTPLVLRILGDVPGTFHNFGSPEYTVRALPLTTNQFVQTKTFRTGKSSVPGDRIPGLIFFNMSQKGGGMLIDTFPDR